MNVAVAIVGAGPYGLSLAAHLAAKRIKHRIFGRPMSFWSQIAAAGGGRYLKSFCFGTNISTPNPGFTFAEYSKPRGLETFEPCSIGDFAQYGLWFQNTNVPWVEPVDVVNVARQANGFLVALDNGESFVTAQLVIATGLDGHAHVPPTLASLRGGFVTHTSQISAFSAFKGNRVAVIGAGQSALEAAALLREAGADPELLIRGDAIRWHTRITRDRGLWRRLRSPISKLGSGPKAWALTRFPGAVHRWPSKLRTDFVKTHLPAEGAWWLRERVEDVVPTRFGTTVIGAKVLSGRLALQIRDKDGRDHRLDADHAIVGSGYVIDVERVSFLDAKLRQEIRRIELAPRLDATFETSVPGLRFIGPASAMSFGPLFRFVVGADYAARVISDYLASASLAA